MLELAFVASLENEQMWLAAVNLEVENGGTERCEGVAYLYEDKG